MVRIRAEPEPEPVCCVCGSTASIVLHGTYHYFGDWYCPPCASEEVS